eukprot:6190866-Pleurochrysis_carterae.AAC.3
MLLTLQAKEGSKEGTKAMRAHHNRKPRSTLSLRCSIPTYLSNKVEARAVAQSQSQQLVGAQRGALGGAGDHAEVRGVLPAAAALQARWQYISTPAEAST